MRHTLLYNNLSEPICTFLKNTLEEEKIWKNVNALVAVVTMEVGDLGRLLGMSCRFVCDKWLLGKSLMDISFSWHDLGVANFDICLSQLSKMNSSLLGKVFERKEVGIWSKVLVGESVGK
jgi:hypothetical protein